MRTLAVIPARSNSSRVPGKNKLRIAGKPCVQYTLDALAQSRSRPIIAVSSDDPEILAIAEAAGVIALEEPAWCVQTDQLHEVLEHVAGLLDKSMGPFDAVLMAHANVPVFPPGIYDEMIDAMKRTRADKMNVQIAVPSHWHPYRIAQLRYGNRPAPIVPGPIEISSQEFPPVFAEASIGSIMTRDVLKRLAKDRYTPHDLRSIVCRDRIVDIDTDEDAQWAEFLLTRTSHHAFA
jgi:N-acylneuraminate cytidylyltransferase